MAAIITSLWKLAENLGLSIKKDTIEEQLNAMNKAVEQKQENNIANALWNYADASGGGPSSLFYIGRSEGEWPLGSNRGIVCYKVDTGLREISISRNDVTGSTLLRNLVYVITDTPTKKFTTYRYGPGLTIYFTPTDDFAGFYNIDDNSEYTTSGDAVTPGDGKCYSYEIAGNGDLVVTKYDYDYSFEVVPSSN